MPTRDEIISELRWKKHKVLDEGFVCLVDVMGDDQAIVQAARVSYGEGTKHISDDRHLIRYLMRHAHSTPFEMAEIKLLVRVPMDTWRQWIRHRTANVNEYSTRYSVAIDATQKTPPTEWRAQAETNRQGSSGTITEWPEHVVLDEDSIRIWDIKQETYDELYYEDLGCTKETCTPGFLLSYFEDDHQKQSRLIYEERLRFGVAREQARKDLPLSTYTEAYWKCDLHNILHFLALRMDPHAQIEIRSYANIIGNEIIKPLFPAVWEAFEDYRLGSIRLSRLDLEMIKSIISKDTITSADSPLFINASRIFGDPEKKSRERDECIAKLKKMGLIQT